MKNYIFKTTATMKPYNNKKWWIDRDIIPEYHITAENITAALNEYKNRTENNQYINISENALKNKEPMYIDLRTGETKQIGFIITAKTEFQYNRDDIKHYGEFSKQYIDLWVSIITTVETDFSEV